MSELIEKTGLPRHTLEVRIHRLGIRPVISEFLYPMDTLEKLRNVPGKGRPRKAPEAAVKKGKK